MAAPEFVESCAPSQGSGHGCRNDFSRKGVEGLGFRGEGERAIQHENHIIMMRSWKITGQIPTTVEECKNKVMRRSVKGNRNHGNSGTNALRFKV